jgi:hypothetical protein
VLTRDATGAERLNFAPALVDPFAERLRRRGLNPKPGDSL